jgi:hypothetical protein
MAEPMDLDPAERFPLLDRSGIAALLAGTLIILITLFTSYSHVDIPGHGSLPINQQIGIPFLVAALAALSCEVKLASNGRYADQRDRVEERSRAAAERIRAAEERIRAAEERNRADQDRERTARRSRIQARLAAAQCRFLLADTPLNRIHLSEALAFLLEDLG